VFITHKETVEKLVHHQAQEADCKVADWIDKVEVFHYVCPRFGQRAVVTHHTDGQDDTVQHLTFSKTSVITLSRKNHNCCSSYIFRVKISKDICYSAAYISCCDSRPAAILEAVTS